MKRAFPTLRKLYGPIRERPAPRFRPPGVLRLTRFSARVYAYSPAGPATLGFDRDKPGSERNHHGSSRGPEIRGQNSRTLQLTAPSELTSRLATRPGRNPANNGDSRSVIDHVQCRPSGRRRQQTQAAMTTLPSPQFTPSARKCWEKILDSAREELLEAVWCGNCLMGTPIQLRSGRMEDECLLLEGTCKICGNA